MNHVDVGKVLSRTFKIFFANFVPFCVLTAVTLLPALIGLGWVLLKPDELGKLIEGGDFAAPLAGVAVVGVLTVLLRPIAAATVTYGVLMQLRGRHAPISACLKVGLARSMPVLGVAILAGLASFFGLFLCCVPGIIAAVGFFVAAPAAVVERPGVFGALSRSWNLTEGSRWAIFGVMFLLNIISSVANKIAEIPMQAMSGGGASGFDEYGSSAPATAGVDTAMLLPFVILSLLITVMTETISAVAQAVTYHDLRTEREGSSSEDLARVFD